MKTGLQKIMLLLFMIAGYATHAQVRFVATLTPPVIGKDEYTQLKLSVENVNEVRQLSPPDLRNFIIVSGPIQQSGMTDDNGEVKNYFAITFILKPKAAGNFTIGPARASTDAGQLTSNPVKLKVTTQNTGNSASANMFTSPFGSFDPFAEVAPRPTFNDYILRKGENPADKIKRNLFIRLETDKKTAYVGEPVVATYKLYTRLKNESDMIKNPSFNGFSVLDMKQPNDGSYHIEKFEGRDYNVNVLRQVQLYPLLTGELELGTAEIENNVEFIKAAYLNRQGANPDDMFRSFTNAGIPPEGIDVQKVTLQSQPMSILVKPLPDAGKPADFKGAVGKFTVEAKVEHDHFSTDDDGKFAIIVAGEGNLQMINAPEIAWPQGVDGFEPRATDDLFKGTVPVSGRKIFEFPFTVTKPGTYVIPAVSFSYFDNREAKYKTVQTKPIEIIVTKGSGKPRQVVAQTTEKRSDHFLARFFSNRLRVVSVVAVLIIIGLVVWLKRDTKKEKQALTDAAVAASTIESEQPVTMILEEQQNPLALSEECLRRNDPALFYKQLNQELKNYLGKKLTLSHEELNRKNIAEQLDAQGISNETSKELQKLLDDIEWQLYTPLTSDEEMKTMYERANSLVQLLNTYRT